MSERKNVSLLLYKLYRLKIDIVLGEENAFKIDKPIAKGTETVADDDVMLEVDQMQCTVQCAVRVTL